MLFSLNDLRMAPPFLFRLSTIFKIVNTFFSLFALGFYGILSYFFLKTLSKAFLSLCNSFPQLIAFKKMLLPLICWGDRLKSVSCHTQTSLCLISINKFLGELQGSMPQTELSISHPHRLPLYHSSFLNQRQLFKREKYSYLRFFLLLLATSYNPLILLILFPSITWVHSLFPTTM